MLLVVISSPAKVDYLDGVIERSEPNFLFKSVLSSSHLSCRGRNILAFIFKRVVDDATSTSIFLKYLVSFFINNISLRKLSSIGICVRELLSIVNIPLSLHLNRPICLVCHLLFGVQFQKNIFWFQISMGQPHFFMHELNSL